MLTSATITDEQIRALHRDASTRIREGRGTDDDRTAWLACELALEGVEPHTNRARCAEILNARASEVAS